MDMPLEIRLMIWHLVIPHDVYFAICKHGRAARQLTTQENSESTNPSLASVNHQIRLETREFLEKRSVTVTVCGLPGCLECFITSCPSKVFDSATSFCLTTTLQVSEKQTGWYYYDVVTNKVEHTLTTHWPSIRARLNCHVTHRRVVSMAKAARYLRVNGVVEGRECPCRAEARLARLEIWLGKEERRLAE